MPGPNTQPVFPKNGNIQWVTGIVTAHNLIDLTSGTSYLVHTADSANGDFIRELRIKASPANNTAAAIMRIWINNGSTTATKANSFLLTEVALPATTASTTNPTPDFVAPINMALNPGYKIYVTVSVAPGGSGEWNVAAVAGSF